MAMVAPVMVVMALVVLGRRTGCRGQARRHGDGASGHGRDLQPADNLA